ncbi:hypothetical protein O0L34_g4847 [Tuta absoluta]|nr:hypothetical protein O0L34_g4847 [Tuta absoluta]
MQFVRDGATIQVSYTPFPNIAVSSYKSEISPEFLICGLINIQVKHRTSRIVDNQYINTHASKYNQTVAVKVSKIFQSDKLNYEIKISSTALGIKDKLLRTDDLGPKNENWLIIKEIENGLANGEKYLTTVDLTINADIYNTNTALFEALYEEIELTDFELRGKDGSVRFHKMVLAAFSPVMRAMLSGTWKELDAGAVDKSEISKATLLQLKDYMYTQKLPESGIEELAILATYYMITDLQQRCAFKMIKSLTAENAAERLEFALKYKIKKLFLAVIAMLKENAITFEDIENKLFGDDE